MADARAQEILENNTVHNGEKYDVEMLWAADNIQLPNNSSSGLDQLKFLEKRFTKDQHLRERCPNTIKKDQEKAREEGVKDSHYVESPADLEWYLLHNPFVNTNKPDKICRVLNGAAKSYGASLKRSTLTGPNLIQILIFVLLLFTQHSFAVSADIEGMFLKVGVVTCDQQSLPFLWREIPTSNVVVHQYKCQFWGSKDLTIWAYYALQRTARDNAKKIRKPQKPSLRTSTWTII